VASWTFALAVFVSPALPLARSKSQGGSATPAGAAAYQTYCAACHGRGGRGDGPLSAQLATRPPDLTTLTQGNEGRFPYDRVYGAIDGRRPVKAHGAMPAWAEAFRGSNGAADAVSVKERITQLTRFVASLQRREAAAKDH
jgi:mono/diheme cytochrome c family protein